MPLYLRETDVANLLDMPSAIHAVAEVMAQEARGEAEVIARGRARFAGGLFHLMGGASAAYGLQCLKAYTSTAAGTVFWILLLNAQGEMEAVIEADLLGRTRTGAASAVASRAMARADSTRMLLIGSGTQALTQAQALAAVFPLEEITVFSRTREHRESFAQRLRETEGLPARSVDDLEEAAASADIITTITSSREPVLEAGWVRPGTHINGCGANILSRQEIPREVFAEAAAVVVDNAGQARLESAALRDAVEAGVLEWEQMLPLSGVAAGAVEARKGDGDITIFASHGLGLWDMACARVCLQKAAGSGGRDYLSFSPEATRNS